MTQTTLATTTPAPASSRGDGARAPRKAARGGRAALLRTLVEGAYVVLLAVLLVRLIVLLRTPVPTPEIDAGNAATGPNVPLSVLSARDPFGGEAGDAPPPAEYADAAETTLNLTLAGLTIGETLTTAAIQTPDGKQSTYAVGQEIVPGVVLRDARPNQAIISRDGITETLTLREDTGAPPPRRRTGVDLPPSAAALTPAQALAAVSAAVTLKKDEEGALTLSPGSNANAFTQAGFAPGDVVVAVNGTAAPADAERVLELIADMPPGRPVTITVERGGIPLDVPLDVRALSR